MRRGCCSPPPSSALTADHSVLFGVEFAEILWHAQSLNFQVLLIVLDFESVEEALPEKKE